VAAALGQGSQDHYIQWYLKGQLPLVPMGERPATVEPRREENRWIRELLDDPNLEAAADLLEAAMPAGVRVRTDGPAMPEIAREASQEKPGGNIWRFVSNIAFYAALVAIVIGAVVFGGQSGGRTQFFGFSYYEVLTGSMESMIPRGSLVVVRQVPSRQIEAGDVITFLRSDEESVTHQVIDVIPDFNGNGALGFRTKGTDNLEPDPDIVAAANVLGVVKLHVPVLGFTLRWVSDNITYVFILFILVILVSIALRVLLGERKKENGPQGYSSSKRAVAI